MINFSTSGDRSSTHHHIVCYTQLFYLHSPKARKFLPIYVTLTKILLSALPYVSRLQQNHILAPRLRTPLAKRGSWEIFIFDHSTFKSHKYSSEHTSRILYVGRYFLNMELWKSLNYKWPGNIRELQNLVEYLTTLSPDAAPKAHWLPPSFLLPPTTEHPDKASTNNDLQLLAQKVYREVRQANEGHYAIGRRSLSIKLQEPESRIREALHLLQSTEKIRSRRGRSGLLALAE